MIPMQNENLIENMGDWEEEGWRWNFRWRRKIFAHEEDLVGDLLAAMNQSNIRDVRVWLGDKSNPFPVSNFV